METTDARVTEIEKENQDLWLPKVAAVNEVKETGVTNPNIPTHFKFHNTIGHYCGGA